MTAKTKTKAVTSSMASRSAIDRHARTKIDGITKRLDRVEKMAHALGDLCDKRNAGAQRDIVRHQQRLDAMGRDRVGAAPLATKYGAALEEIRRTGCMCAHLAPVGSTLHANTPTMPLNGTDHLAACHVAIAAKALGR